MANLMIRYVPTELYRLLKRRAKAHRQTLGEEVIAALQGAIDEGRPTNAQTLIPKGLESMTRALPELTPPMMKLILLVPVAELDAANPPR